MQTPMVKRRFASERLVLGLSDPPKESNIGVSGKPVSRAKLEAEVKEYDASLEESEARDEVEIQLSDDDTDSDRPRLAVREKTFMQEQAPDGSRTSH